jgi:protein SCO1
MNCPDICPIHLSQLKDVLARPGMPANIEVVFVTVDPDRDSPEVLAAYLDQFNADFVGLTGTEEEVVAAQKAFGAIVALRESDDANYTMGHDGRVFAFTPQGNAYTQYPHPTRQSAWVHDLPILATIDSAEGAVTSSAALDSVS